MQHCFLLHLGKYVAYLGGGLQEAEELITFNLTSNLLSSSKLY